MNQTSPIHRAALPMIRICRFYAHITAYFPNVPIESAYRLSQARYRQAERLQAQSRANLRRLGYGE